ncbi:MAG: polysaccharide biosynthesis tyrosine autokinase [Candidatus Hydrogenedentes bacterium]|nr:polysaccharide biosynthesis tyrosine autokinase [Candidatus Hydrogenedentota bacterium]
MPTDFTTETATQLIPIGAAPSAGSAGRGINLKRLVRTRGPVMIAISAALAVPLLVAVWFVIPREYEATAMIRFSHTRPTILSTNQEIAVASDYGQYVETQVNLIKGAAVLGRVSEREDVRTLPSMVNRRDPAYYLAQELQARIIPSSELVQVSYQSSDRNTAHTIVRATVEEFLKHASQANQVKDAEITRELQKEQDDLETQISALSQAVSDRRKNVGGVISESGGIGVDAERQAYFDNLGKAIDEKESAETAVEQFEAQQRRIAELIEQNAAKPSEPVYEFGIETIVASDPAVQVQTNQLAAKDSELSRSANFQKDSPRYVALTKERNSLAAGVETAKQQARSKALLSQNAKTDIDLEAATKRVADASKRVDKFDQELREHASDNIEYGKAMSELKEKEAELADVRDMLRNVKDRIRIARADSRAPASIDVAVAPQAPSVPDFKKRLKVMILVCMMACGAGFAFGLYRELTDQQVRTVLDLKYVTDLPMMAMIPDLSAEKLPSNTKAALLTAEHPDSISADEFRRVLTRIIYPPEGSAELNTCLVTSASRSDGKTTLACNLAISLAQANRRVLLLDICARRPSVEKTLGMERGTGLGEVFANQVSLQEAVRSAPIANLYVMGPGFLTTEVIGKLASRDMVEFLEKAEEAFEHVLIDSPPTLLMADAKLLAPVVDGVIMVVGAEVSSLGMVRRALSELQQIGSNVIGVVLNRAKPVAGGYMRDNLEKFYNYGKESVDASASADESLIGPSPEKIDGDELPTMILLEDRAIRPKQDGA